MDAKKIHVRNTLLERMMDKEGRGVAGELREEPEVIYVGEEALLGCVVPV